MTPFKRPKSLIHFPGKLLASSSLICVLAIFSATTAQAGFEWNPPTGENVSTGKSIMPDPVDMDDGSLKQQRKIDAMSMNPSAEKSDEVMSKSGIDIEPMDDEIADASASNGMMEKSDPVYVFETVQGFGQQIPLALALRQVVPASFALSFDGVPAGRAVDWAGGRGWNEALIDIVASINAKAAIDGNNITIMPAGDGQEDIERLHIVNAPASILDQAQVQLASTPTNDNAPTNLFGDIEPTEPVMMETALWTAVPGERVTDVLKAWTKSQKTELFWNVQNDYTLEESFRAESSLENATIQLLNAATGGNAQFDAQVYPNLPDGPAVLLVREVDPDNS